MDRLLKIGFVNVGRWRHNDIKIDCLLDLYRKQKNVLYTFVVNGTIMYIGKTVMTLEKRMYGYQNPGPTQSTNIRVNKKISDSLLSGQAIDIFILADNGLLKYGDFSINLAAGLEDTLIYEINPEWNFAGKNKMIEDKASAENLISEISEERSEECKFTVNIGESYYNKGFFNVGQEFSHNFGADKALIEVQLGSNSDNLVTGYVNRTANPKGTPRIMIGKEYTNWIKKNFVLGDSLIVSVNTPESIRIDK